MRPTGTVLIAAAAVVLIAVAALSSFSAMAQSNENPWVSDREIASGLRQNGVRQEGDRAILWFEPGVLAAAQMEEFSALVNRGILDIETYLRLPEKPWKVRYYVSAQTGMSHSLLRSIFLPVRRVQDRTAPYLHETVHILAPCQDCPMWFSEGLASYVQSYVSEHVGGYDGVVFARWGNRGIDSQARHWLGRGAGQAVLPFIGKHDEPPAIAYDRSNVAAPFYVMAQSFVKFLAERAGIQKLDPVLAAEDFESAMLGSTGASADEWKQNWLASLETK